jgi:hypothetical protein
MSPPVDFSLLQQQLGAPSSAEADQRVESLPAGTGHADEPTSRPLPEIYYDHNLKVFWIRDAGNQFIQMTELGVSRLLRSLGFSLMIVAGALL